MEDANDHAGGASATSDKDLVRQRVWDKMEAQNVVPYPRPCHGRIPNFFGAEQACERIAALPEFAAAHVIKVHPSLGATRLRELVLDAGKTLLVPPLPGHNFLYYLVDPAMLPQGHSGRKVADKRGFQRYGKPIASLADIPNVDLVVVASVAVTEQGVRLGKGKGYGEVEYGILREVGAVTPCTPVASVCHDVQVVPDDELPTSILEEHDLPVDFFCTPTRTVRMAAPLQKPTGIIWSRISADMEHDIGALVELRSMQAAATLRPIAATHEVTLCNEAHGKDGCALEHVGSGCVKRREKNLGRGRGRGRPRQVWRPVQQSDTH